MDQFQRNKKPPSGLFPSTRVSELSAKHASSSRDQNKYIPVCSRVGCSSRISLSSRTSIGVSNNTKPIKQPFQLSTGGKEIIGSSSKQPPLPVVVPRKIGSDQRRKLPSHRSTISVSNNGLPNDLHLSEPVLTTKKSRIRLSAHTNVQAYGESTSQETSSSSLNLTSLSKSGGKASGKNSSIVSSSSSTSLTFRTGSFRARNDASTNRLQMKNVKSNSMSNGALSGCSSSSSSSESNHGREREAVGRKRNSEAQSSSSSAKEKKVNGTFVNDRKVSVSNGGGGISISDSSRARNSAASGRDNSSNRGTIGSSVTRQGTAVRSMLNGQEIRNRPQRTDSAVSRPLFSTQRDTTRSANGLISRCHLRTPPSSSRTNTSSRPGSSSGRSSVSSEIAFGRSITTREDFRIYNLDGIAEMLLALETNLLVGTGISYHDRYRDMRLDIDNMTYEELLALEERMGTVSTALPEEALEKCLWKSIFHGSSPTGAEESGGRVVVADEIKCSICQEEYTDGEELGKLGCKHKYHLECITQWLKLKNWCPICKASAQPSSLS